jgi:outer membrane protein TolC
MRTVLFCAAAMACLTPHSVGAQAAVLTESEALARLSADSPRIRAIRAGIDVARMDILAAGRTPNPRFNWDRQSVAGVSEHLVTVSQPLPVTGRRALEVQSASARAAARSSRTDDEVRRVRADLRLAFADLQAAQNRERELERARDRLQVLTGALAAREAQGDAAGFDRLRAEREVLDVEADRVLAATDRARAQATLAGFFTDVGDPSHIIVSDSRAPAPAIPSLEALLEQAETRRGELAAFHSDLEAARFADRAASRSLVPEPELFVGAKTSTASGGGLGSAVTIGGGDIGPVVGVHATIPLFDRAGTERAMAAARAAQAQSGAEAFRLVLRGHISALRASVIGRREITSRYRAEAVSRADEIERIAQISYDAGERTILELLDALRAASSARVRQTALDLAVRQAEIELEFASGWEMPS